MIEYDGYYNNEAELDRFTIDYNSIKKLNGGTLNPSQRGFSLTSDVYYAEQRDFIKKCVQTIWNVIYDATYNQHSDLSRNPYHTMDNEGNYVEDRSITSPREAIEKVVDVNSLVDMYILQEICLDMDLGWSSFYFSIDMSEKGNHKLTFNAPWDFDSSLGMATNFSANNALSAMNGGNPWLVIFNNQNWFWKIVEAKWNKATEAGVFSGVLGMIDYYSQNFADIYKKNFDRWPNSINKRIEGQQVSIVETFRTEAEAANYLKTWLSERITNLTRLFAERSALYDSAE